MGSIPLRRQRYVALLGLAAGGCLVGCGGAGDDGRPPPAAPEYPRDVLDPPYARWAQVEELEAGLAAPRHPSDGGGSARLLVPTADAPPPRVGEAARFEIEYAAGPLGIAPGGSIYLLPDPFWNWSEPQDYDPDGLGYTRAATDADGVELRTESLGAMLLIEISGRALAEGETVHIEYGAGRGARVDRYAERGARIWIGVDGDGDGVRVTLPESPRVTVAPGPAERLVLLVTSTAQPGETVRLTAALIDYMGDVAESSSGSVLLEDASTLRLPEVVTIGAEDRGARTVEFLAGAPGIVRVRGSIEIEGATLEAESNPLWIGAVQPVLWADVHGHSNFSDGTGLPEDYFRFARDVAALDVVALTDHDHFGVLFLDERPELWEEIKNQVARFNDPGRFVTLLGYEWTSWIHGHRHVLYFGDEGEVHSSLDPEVRTPRQLWDRLRGSDALTFAHHSAGNPVPTNWSFAPDPELEPVTEVMSVHGSSEAEDSPSVIGGARRGNFVRDVLDRGYRLGFIGSGDSHDGHPGLPHLSPGYGYRERGDEQINGTGGVAAILSADRTRAGVLRAMRGRAVYATSGPRILLHIELEGTRMGRDVAADSLPEECALQVSVVGTSGLERLDVIRSGEVAERLLLDGERQIDARIPLERLRAGEYVYVRVLQNDRGLAWSSPIFIE